MNEFYIRNVVEAALLAAGKPLQLAELGQLFDDNESARPKTEDLQAALAALAADYTNRGLEVKETAAGFRIQVRKEFASEISRLWPERPAKYSRALLETLALIAYRQPITRAEIEAVRGVAVNPNIVKTVIERNWVRVVGHRDVPGRPELLGTTRDFLDYFGLRSLDELPALADVKALGDYNLQLELPNASGTAGEGGEGAAVAGLLANEAGGEGTPEGGTPAAEGVASEGAVGQAAVEGAVAEHAAGGVAVEGAVAEHAAGGVAVEGVASGHAVGHGQAPVEGAVSGHAVGEAAAEGVAAEGATGQAAAEGVASERAVGQGGVEGIASEHAVSQAAVEDAVSGSASSEGALEGAISQGALGEAVAEGADVVAQVAMVEVESVMADGSDAEALDAEGVTSASAAVEGTETIHSAHDAVAANSEIEDESEAERTLGADSASQHTAESDESEGSESNTTKESLETLDDPSEDDDEDELSADGHGSRELVAAPRDGDD